MSVETASLIIVPIVVIFVGAVVGPVLAARNGRKMKDTLGVPNGQGNVVQMLEKLLHGQAGQDGRLANLELHSISHHARLQDLELAARQCPLYESQHQDDEGTPT